MNTSDLDNLLHPAPKGTKAQMLAAFELVVIVGQAIRELKEIPSGHLYAQLMGKLTLSQYESILNTLKRAKMIKIEYHLITWIGPTN